MNSYPSYLNSTALKIVANHISKNYGKYVCSMRQLTGSNFNLHHFFVVVFLLEIDYKSDTCIMCNYVLCKLSLGGFFFFC